MPRVLAAAIALFLCSFSSPGSAFTIWKVEATQGIQILDWWGPCNAVSVEPSAPACPDNMLRLVAGKATAVRVFLEGTSEVKARSLTGVLEIREAKGRRAIARIPAHNGPVSRQRLLGFKRHETHNSLNFRIPAALATGGKTISISVFDPRNPRGGLRRQAARTLHFEPIEVSVHGIMASVLPSTIFSLQETKRPAEAAFRASFEHAARLLPAQLRLVALEHVDVDLDATVRRLGLPSNLRSDAIPDIMSTLASEHHRRLGRRQIVFLVFPAALLNRQMGVPPTYGLEGDGNCTSFGASSGTDDLRLMTLAHEIGHNLGLAHSYGPPRDGEPPVVGPHYPRVPGTPDGSILTEGFDVDLMTVVAKTTADIMHYRLETPRWLSPFTHAAMLSCITGR